MNYKKNNKKPLNSDISNISTTMTSNKKSKNVLNGVTEQDGVGKAIESKIKQKHVKKKNKNNAKVISDDGEKLISPSVNAFQILMGAQKRVIGANSPGKECTVDAEESEAKSIEKSVKVKRNLFLAEWADSKGSGKKKLIELEQEKRTKRLLNNRKKNFTNMLLNKNKMNKSDEINSSPEIIDNAKGAAAVSSLKSKPKRGRIAKKHRKEELDSDSENEFVNKKVCLQNDSSVDSDEFIKKLGPSIKKKEDVLSYFKKLPKTNSDNHKTVPDKIESTESLPDKKKPRSKSVKPKIDKTNKNILNTKKDSKKQIIVDENGVNNNDDTCKINGKESNGFRNRVRRSKNININYAQDDSSDSDVDISEKNILTPKKNDNVTQNVYFDPKSLTLFIEEDNIVSPIKIINIRNTDIKCIRSPKSTKKSLSDKSEVKENTKIAPLFVKKLSKQPIDSEAAAARLKFLYSETPMNKQKQIDVDVAEVIIIPEISHIQQRPIENDAEFYIWNLSKPTSIPFMINGISDITPRISKTSYFNQTSVVYDLITNRTNSELFELFKISDHKEILKRMKELHPKFPIYKTFRQLKDKFDNVNKSCEENEAECNKNESLDVEIIDSCEPPNKFNKKENDLWTDKYKLSSSDEIIGNFKSVSLLKKWLVAWKECSQNISSKLKTRTIDGNASSSDDFFTSDSESDEISLPNNTTVVVGPKGCGKTSAIYAIANELEFNILEVNASSKRTGKRIMTELQEATQSHKVLTKKTQDSTKITSIFGNKNGLKPKANKRTTKSKKEAVKILKNGIGSTESESKDVKKMSLMLIDDADIIFDEDDGFVSALNHIIGISKRPIVIITSDIRCSHLKKIISDNNIIKFSAPPGKIIGPWLDVMLLLECGKYFPNLSSRLIDLNKGDVRSTIHQLQFWLSNKNDIWKEVDAINNKTELILDENNLDTNEESNMSWKDANYLSGSNNCTKSSDDQIAVNEILKNMTNITNVDDNSWNIYNIYENMSSNCEIENDFDIKENNSDKISHDIKENINAMSDMMDSFSVIDAIRGQNDITNERVSPWHIDLCNSLSENENDNAYNECCEFSRALSEHIICRNMKFARENHNANREYNALDKRLAEIRWRDKHHYVHNKLVNIVPMSNQLDRAGLTLDYMSTLRNISRTERYRSESNMKRNNRFYHYLRSLNVNINDSIYRNACDVFKNEF